LTPCAGARSRRVEGTWYLPSEEIRAERLNLEVTDEPSAINYYYYRAIFRTRNAHQQLLLFFDLPVNKKVPPLVRAVKRHGERYLQDSLWRESLLASKSPRAARVLDDGLKATAEREEVETQRTASRELSNPPPSPPS
jgi:hypothetical protein